MILNSLVRKRIFNPAVIGLAVLAFLGIVLTRQALDIQTPSNLIPESEELLIQGTEDNLLQAWIGKQNDTWNVQGTAQINSDSPTDSLLIRVTGNDPILISPKLNVRLEKWHNLRVKAVVRTQQDSRLQLFVDNGDGFSEERSNSTFIQGGWVWRTVEIPLPKVQQVVQLRLDPSGQSEFVEFLTIQLFASKKKGAIDIIQQSWDKHKFVWFKDDSKDVAMGVQVGDEKDASWGVRFHGKDLGPTEYTCFPDDILVFQPPGDRVKMAYAAYLEWQRELNLNEQKNIAKVTLQRKFDDPKLYRYIEPEFLERVSQIPVDVKVTHSLKASIGSAWTTIEITNQHNTPAHIYWIWQDAAYHWLENKDLDDVHLLSSVNRNLDSISVINTKTKNNPWIASADFKHHVGFALWTTDPATVFHSDRYLYTERVFSPDEMKFSLGGNDRFLMKANPASMNEILNSVNENQGKQVSKDSLKNRVIVLDFGIVNPGKTVIRKYARTFERDFSSPQDLSQKLETAVNQNKNNYF